MVETNLFLFQFSNDVDKEKIMRGCPWFFDNQLPLKEISGHKQLAERVHGGFIKYDDTDPLGLENSMRVKVTLDISKPLRRGMRIATCNSVSKWVDIKYERLGDFCYICEMS
ncbi:hypothetical protein RDABS01_031685, partial [Bienertia sinuspersici]